ncbi:hypothetical protein ACMGDM_20380 [Sphingomonas sp. DT-51]|uniref:hypothetical protein n=1 Tax=Sphingomonas sp. DT-51 TaxID=3396165 RepID=UPI003F1CE762
MSIFDRLGEWFSRIDWSASEGAHHHSDDHTRINPATGLPMMGNNIGGVDVGGSPFGTDSHRWHDDHGSRAFHESSSSTDWHHTSASSYDPSRGW